MRKNQFHFLATLILFVAAFHFSSASTEIKYDKAQLYLANGVQTTLSEEQIRHILQNDQFSTSDNLNHLSRASFNTL